MITKFIPRSFFFIMFFFVAILCVSCGFTQNLASEPTQKGPDISTIASTQKETIDCSRDELDRYLRQSDNLIKEFLDDMMLAIDNPDKTAAISLVMMMAQSDYKLITPPECGETHKQLMLDVMDASLDYIINGKDPDKEAGLYQNYLAKLKKASEEQDLLIRLLDSN